MKKILLTTTAIALTAGYAAAEVSVSGSAKLVYGNFGTGDWSNTATSDNTKDDPSKYSYGSEFGVTFSASGTAGGVSYSGALTLDEGEAV